VETLGKKVQRSRQKRSRQKRSRQKRSRQKSSKRRNRPDTKDYRNDSNQPERPTDDTECVERVGPGSNGVTAVSRICAVLRPRSVRQKVFVVRHVPTVGRPVSGGSVQRDQLRAVDAPDCARDGLRTGGTGHVLRRRARVREPSRSRQDPVGAQGPVLRLSDVAYLGHDQGHRSDSIHRLDGGKLSVTRDHLGTHGGVIRDLLVNQIIKHRLFERCRYDVRIP